MKYYRAKKEAYDYATGWSVVKDELITEVERNRMFKTIKRNIFEEINVSKNNVFFSFGCRFEKK